MLLTTKEMANNIYADLTKRVEGYRGRNICPLIVTILIGNDPASEYYVNAKERIAKKIGVDFKLLHLEAEVKQSDLLEIIEQLNNDSSVHGIMLELPLPSHIELEAVANVISPLKDIDGITPENKMACMSGAEGLYPATPQSCIRILKEYGYTIQGKRVVLIGRGETVGKPLINLLLRENATLTICHSHTNNLAFYTQEADIIIAAVGKPNLVMPEMVSSKNVIIDAGINETTEGIVGDVTKEVREHVSAISPVPGGVGTLTTAILFENLLAAIELQNKKRG